MFLEVFEQDDIKPTKSDIYKFNLVRQGKRIDYSKDPLNVALKKLYTVSLNISNDKTRKKFSETIYKNMGNLSDLVKNIRKLNNDSIDNNKQKEIEEILNKIEV